MNALTRDTVLFNLAMHVGADQGVRACDLVLSICQETSPALERQLRRLIEELRLQGQHICGLPATGYFMASSEDELLQTVEFLHDRAISSLSQAAAMRNVSLPDLRGQLRIRLEPPQGAALADQPAVSVENSGSQSPAVLPRPGDDLAPTQEPQHG